MGAMGRLSFLGVLVGLLVAVVPAGTASAEGPCAGPLAQWLDCWTANLDNGTPYVVTINEELSLVGPGQQQHQILKKDVEKRRHQLVVEVPKGERTGDGGTALLVLAGGRMVHPDARIDRIPRWAVDELDAAGVCVPQRLCELIVESDSQPKPLEGRELITEGLVADLSTHVGAIAPVSQPPTTGHERDRPDDKGDKGNEDSKGGKGDKGQGGNNNVGPTDEQASGYSGTTWAALWMGLLLALLLLAFVIVIRHSRGPVAVGHRAPPGRRAGGRPAHASGSATATATATTVTAAPAHAARGEEATARLRVAPTTRHGRQVGGRPAHARTGVVRTELHPQGYVELDRVLYRAVWAEPGRPPPAPGGLVDVTEARERDSDVLYAFPPTAARHAKGTPR